MIGGIQVKVCGLTRASDARAAANAGADFLGFIFYPKSPRNLEIEAFEAMRSDLPDLPKVAVMVAPEDSLLDALEPLGFDFFQIHYAVGSESIERIRSWSERLSPQRLWLAPKIGPGDLLGEESLALADTWLWDAYRKDAFGGTGQLSDWAAFREMAERYPDKLWTLAGGLNPENVAEAVNQTGAKRVDLNSGVEHSPGIKDLVKINQVRESLQNS